MVSAAQVAILATGTLASAAVVRRADACAGITDATACASTLAKSFVIKTDASVKYTMNVPWNLGRPPAPNGYINPEVTLALSGCKLSSPVVTKKGSAANCGATSCKKTLAFDVTSTTTEAARRLFSATTDGQMLFTSPDPSVYDPSLYSAQTLTPKTTTINKDLTLAANQNCVPTTVQYTVACTASLTPTTTSWPTGGSMGSIQCGQPMMNSPTNAYFLDFCTAVKPGYTFPVTIDVHQPTGETWAYEGCSSS